MMKLGYARVSTNEQDTAAQVSALKSAGCEKIFREKASGGRWDRPELVRLLDQLRKDDVLIVSRLDRLSRSLRDLLMIMERIKLVKIKPAALCPRSPWRSLGINCTQCKLPRSVARASSAMSQLIINCTREMRQRRTLR